MWKDALPLNHTRIEVAPNEEPPPLSPLHPPAEERASGERSLFSSSPLVLPVPHNSAYEKSAVERSD